MNKLRGRILAGEITFEDAARQFSDDKETRMNRGLILNPQTSDTKFDLTRMDPQLYNRVSSVKPGEITDAFYEEVRGEDKMFKILKVNEKIETHIADFTLDYEKIQKLALQKKQEEVVEEWAKEKLSDTYIKINKEYVKCDFQKNWNKL